MSPDLSFGRSRADDRLRRARRIRLAEDGQRSATSHSEPALAEVVACAEACLETCGETVSTVQAA